MYNSKVLNEDIQNICKDTLIPWTLLQNSTVLVTGGTGMLGSLLIKTLLAADEKYGLNLIIIAVVREKSRAETFFSDKRIRFYERDIREKLQIAEPFDYVIHCASVTTSRIMVENPVGTIETSVNGTQNLLKEAKVHGIKSMVYLSSMEVYGRFDKTREVDESCLGFIDVFNPRSSYPEGKRMCECLCSSFYHQYRLPVKIVRLAQVFGPGIKQTDNRVYAQFAKSVMESKDIVLHTEGNSVGNYCYTSDAVRAILLILLKGKDGEAYNVANESNTMSIRQMAELVCSDIADGSIKCRLEIPANSKKLGYAPASNYRLNASKLRNLGWNAEYSVYEMFQRLISDWSNR